MEYCDRCGAKLKEDAKFCTKCGHLVGKHHKTYKREGENTSWNYDETDGNISAKKGYCGKCGAQLKDNAEFCLMCGHLVEKHHKTYKRGEEYASEEYEEIVKIANKDSNYSFVFVLVLIFFGIIVFAARNYNQAEEKKEAETQLNDVGGRNPYLPRNNNPHISRTNTLGSKINKKINANQYSKYVGRWITRKTTEHGIKILVEIKLNDNHSGYYACFRERGNALDMVVCEECAQCILSDGVIYMTKDGDINGRAVVKIKVGSDGLYSFDGDKYIRQPD